MTRDASGMIWVLVVDDEPMVCAHLSLILSSAPDIAVAEPAHDGAAAVEAVIGRRPHVVLMDLRMPGVDGLAAIDRIRQLPAAPPVVALTTFDTDDYVLRALQAGAAGFLVKSTPPEDLIELVRVVAAGHTVMSPSAAARLVTAATADFAARGRARQLAGLTERENQILACLCEGLSNDEIAWRLHLSQATVKGYVSRMLEKLDCGNRTQLALLAQHREAEHD